MLELAEQARFAKEALEGCVGKALVEMDRLDGDVTIERDLRGAIDDAHTSLADLALDLVGVLEQPADERVAIGVRDDLVGAGGQVVGRVGHVGSARCGRRRCSYPIIMNPDRVCTATRSPRTTPARSAFPGNVCSRVTSLRSPSQDASEVGDGVTRSTDDRVTAILLRRSRVRFAWRALLANVRRRSCSPPRSRDARPGSGAGSVLAVMHERHGSPHSRFLRRLHLAAPWGRRVHLHPRIVTGLRDPVGLSQGPVVESRRAGLSSAYRSCAISASVR